MWLSVDQTCNQPRASSADARQVRKRIECGTRDLHQSLLVKISRAMARTHGDPGTGGQAPVVDIQGAHGAPGEVCSHCAICVYEFLWTADL